MAKQNVFDELALAFKVEFSLEIATTYDLLGCQRHITERKDGRSLTIVQRKFISGFIAAWDRKVGGRNGTA